MMAISRTHTFTHTAKWMQKTYAKEKEVKEKESENMVSENVNPLPYNM